MNKIQNIFLGKLCKTLYFLALSASFMLVSCVTSGGSNEKPNKNNTLSQSIYFADMGAIPLTIGSNASYQLSLFNGSAAAVHINSVDTKLIGAKLKDRVSTTDIIDSQECSIIQPHGQCVIRINLGNNLLDDTGEFGLQVIGHTSTGEELKATSVISYFTPNKSTDLAYSTVGIGQFNITENKPINVNVPIYFMKDYTQIKINNNNPSIKAELLDCKTEVFANSACTLRVSFIGGTKQNGLIEFLGKLKTSTANDDVQNLFSLSVSNDLDGIGHLLLGTTQSSIIENGKDIITLTLVNNGNGPIKDLNINPDSSILKINKNSCENSLNIGADCEVSLITSPSTKPLSISNINFSYNNGHSNNPLEYQIIVKPQTGQIGKISANLSGDFTNTPNGVSRSVVVTYSNTGNVAINNFKIEPTGSFPDGMKVYKNDCLSKTTLEVNDKCDYVIEYKPEKTIDKNKIKISASAEYNNGGQAITTLISNNIDYSSYSSSGYIHFSPEKLIFTVLSNKSDNKVITIENYSDSAATDLSLSIDMTNKEHNSDYKITKSASENIENCLDKKNLQPHEACSITISFGPHDIYSDDLGILKADFKINGMDVNNTLSISSDAIKGVAQVSINKISAIGSINGSGTENDSYIFNTLKGNDGEIFIEYINNGTVGVKSFSVSNILPIGYTIDLDSTKTTCPTNGNIGQLPVNQKCVLAIKGYNPEIDNFISKDSEINITIPSVSYIDEDNKFTEQDKYGIIYSKFNALNNGSINVSPTSVEEVDGETYYTNTVTYKITNSSSELPVKFSIISPQGSGDSVIFQSSTNNNSNYCNIETGQVGASCSIKMYYDMIPVTILTQIDVNGLYWQYGVVVDNVPPPQAILTTKTKDLEINDPIIIKFTNPITNLDTSNLSIKKTSQNQQDIKFSIDGDTSNTLFTIKPIGMELANNYSITLSDGIIDKYQKHLEKTVFQIQTKSVNYAKPTLVSPNVTVNVPRNTDMIIGFDSNTVDCLKLNNHVTLKLNDTDDIPVTLSAVSTNTNKCKININSELKSSAKYELAIAGGQEISAGVTTVETHFIFSTNQDVVIVPTLQSCNTKSQYKTVTLNLKFDHDIDSNTFQADNLSIVYFNQNLSISAITQDSPSTYHLTFDANSTGNGAYKLQLSKNICDNYGDCINSQSMNFKLTSYGTCQVE